MYWARYVLLDQVLRGGGMRSTEFRSSLKIIALTKAMYTVTRRYEDQALDISEESGKKKHF